MRVMLLLEDMGPCQHASDGPRQVRHCSAPLPTTPASALVMEAPPDAACRAGHHWRSLYPRETSILCTEIS